MEMGQKTVLTLLCLLLFKNVAVSLFHKHAWEYSLYLE